MADDAEVDLCVFCRRHAVDPQWRPFCGERCKLQDLARWADGSYLAPGEPLSDPQDPEHGAGKSQKD